MNKFEIGLEYSTPSICDFNCIFRVLIVARTEKTVITSFGKRLRIFIVGTSEAIRPLGKYSFAPIITALDK